MPPDKKEDKMSIEYKKRTHILPKPIDGSDEHTTTCCIIYEEPHEHFVDGNQSGKYINKENK